MSIQITINQKVTTDLKLVGCVIDNSLGILGIALIKKTKVQ